MSVSGSEENFRVLLQNFEGRSFARRGFMAFFKCDFDGFKNFPSEPAYVGHDNDYVTRWNVSVPFMYVTKYYRKLQVKTFAIELYQKRKLGAPLMLGVCLMDLYTLATGPVHHSMLLLHPVTNEPFGRLDFDAVFEHQRLFSIDLLELQLKFDHHNDSDPESALSVSNTLAPKNIVKSEVHRGITADWEGPISVWADATMKELLECVVVIEVHNERGIGRKIGEVRLGLQSYFSMRSDASTFHKNIAVSEKGAGMTGVLSGKIHFQNTPQYCQMLGGVHTEAGVRHARPLLAGALLPFILGDVNKRGAVRQKLPQGWERRKDPSGRTYYVDHVKQITSWENPLKPADLFPSLNRKANLIMEPRAEEDRAAAVIQRAFRRHLVSKGRSDLVPPLPANWEQRVDPASGRTYYVNHKDKFTTWVHPRQERRPEPAYELGKQSGDRRSKPPSKPNEKSREKPRTKREAQ